MLRAWVERRFTLVTSEWQLDELGRVSRYPRLRASLTPHEVGRLIGRMRRHAVVFAGLPAIAVSPEPDDDPLVATAIVGEVHWLVTGDKGDLLVLKKVHGVKIVAARQLVEFLGLT
ncbi:MAG: hypothetical protein P1P87_03195 [Trueperaceae bacterium]|nr:hypothetical protein [Trueperaceae bacterium]